MSGEAAYTNFIVYGLTYTFISNEFEGKNTIQQYCSSFLIMSLFHCYY